MKKRKTYEVSVINKTYSKTYSDQTKFFTSDTALELNFQLKEVEYDFDSAEIILLNVDDRSLATRPVTKSAEGFTYELEDDIVEHYGEWKCQLKFNEGGEIYVSSPVGFRIENDLSNDRPPQMTEVNTWKNLRKIADSLISDIRSELESVAEQLLEIESAETQRASAESSRVSAENQRKMDHENRSNELAGKADKVVIKNLVKNGDFSDGLTKWTIQNGANVSVTTEGAEILSIKNSLQIYQSISAPVGDMLYSAVLVKTDSQNNFAYSTNQSVIPINSNSQDFQLVSSREKRANGAYLSIDRINSDGTQKKLTLKYMIALNLTQTFGAGNEPTKEEMDELVKVTGYFNGEYAINNREMLGHLMKGIREKADKKQEDWITLPLYNGAQHGDSPLKVMKDEMGVVHFKGSLTNLVSGSKVFGVPVEYRPDIGATESRIRIPVALNTQRGTNNLQINYVGDGYIFNSSNTEIAYFDGVSYLAKRS